MKKLTFLFMFLLYTLLSYGQNYVGATWSFISQEMNKQGFKQKIAVADDGTWYVVYIDFNNHTTRGYYFTKEALQQEHLCTSYMMMYPYKYINDVIKALNDKYVSKGENIWIQYGLTDYIWLLEKHEDDDEYFTVTVSIRE